MFERGMKVRFKNELNLQTNIGFRVKEIVKDCILTLHSSYSHTMYDDMWLAQDENERWLPVCERDLVVVSIFKDTDYESV